MDVKLMVTKGGSRGKTVQLRRAETIVGRASGCNVRIPSASVSRRHCRFLFQNDYLVVEDLDSANGTFVNGTLVKRQAVRPGDRIEVGPVVFVAKYLLSPEALERIINDDEQGGDLVEVEAVDDVPAGEADVPEVEVDVLESKGPRAPKVAPKEKPAKPPPPPPPATAKKKRTEKAAPAKPESPKTLPPQKEQDVPVELPEHDAAASWHTSGGDDLRDILSQIEDA